MGEVYTYGTIPLVPWLQASTLNERRQWCAILEHHAIMTVNNDKLNNS